MYSTSREAIFIAVIAIIIIQSGLFRAVRVGVGVTPGHLYHLVGQCQIVG